MTTNTSAMDRLCALTARTFRVHMSDATTCAPETKFEMPPEWAIPSTEDIAKTSDLSRARSGNPKISDKKIQKIMQMRGYK